MKASINVRLRDLLDRTFGRRIGRASVFGLMRDPVVLLDARDTIIDVNPAFERRLTDAVVAARSGDRRGTATALTPRVTGLPPSAAAATRHSAARSATPSPTWRRRWTSPTTAPGCRSKARWTDGPQRPRRCSTATASALAGR